jgi:GTP-binding protein
MNGPNFVGSFPDHRNMPAPDRAEVAVAGRSNVGKSSAINCIVGRKRIMRVSGKPGATRLLNVLDWGPGLRLVDLPGYGFARVSKAERAQWGRMVRGYLEARESLVMLLLVLDLRHPPRDTDLQLLEWARAAEIQLLVLFTKADKLSRNQAAVRRRALLEEARLEAGEALLFSARTGLGRDQVIAQLDQLRGRPSSEG